MNNRNKRSNLTEVHGFKVGYKVRIKPVLVETSQGSFDESWLSHKEGYILEFYSSYDWKSEPDMATLRLYYDLNQKTGEYESASNCSIQLQQLVVIDTASEGPVVVGKSCPYSRSELRELFVKQKLQEISEFDFSIEGYRNMATHVAALYLNQDSRFHDRLTALRRKDGTVNPAKVESTFKQLGLQVEDGAFEAPVRFSNIDLFFYRDIHDAIRKAQAIDWKEVAEDFVETV